jgi:hypothetical protein
MARGGTQASTWASSTNTLQARHSNELQCEYYARILQEAEGSKAQATMNDTERVNGKNIVLLARA